MAILKNTTVSGSLRATDTLAAQTAQFKILNAPTTSNGTTYGPGTNGNFLRSNGTSAYWSALAASDLPSHTHSYAGSSSAGGAATYATTTADTSNTLYPIGVTNGATTTLKRDTSITMTGGTISANKYLATHTSGASNEFRVVYGSTIDMAFMVGTANENHGIYDYKKGTSGSWILSAGADNNWTFNGNAATATAFSAAKSVALTGDVTGSASSTGGWSVATTIKSSVNLTGTPTLTNTPTAGDNSKKIATTEFVMNAFTANDAMLFKGVVNADSDLPATHYQGWTYKVATAGTYANKVCEVGDMIICVTDGTAANNDHWAIIQNNVDGAVFKGANAFTDGDILLADGTNGKIKDSGIKFDGSTTTKWLTQKGTWSAPTAAQVGAATSGHTHTLSIAADSGTNQLTLAASTKYKLTAGGSTYIFTTPPNNAVTHTVKTTTKYYITGTETSTTSTGGDTFDTGIYATTTAGELSAVRHSYNNNGTEKLYTCYNSTDNSLDFIFI